MYVLFDDGKTFDRRLRYEDNDPTPTYLGRYEPTSEAFRFFSSIDNIWGDYRKRDEEEDMASYGKLLNLPVGQIVTKADKAKVKSELGLLEKANELIFKYNEKYYMKYKDGVLVDIAKIDSKILAKDKVKGIAFTIFKEESFQDIFEDIKSSYQDPIVKCRQQIVSYYLDVKIVDTRANKEPKIAIQDRNLETISPIELIENTDYKDYPIKDGNTTTYQLGPTLVLNKETILKNRNYLGGDWQKPPKDWKNMIAENPNNWKALKDYIKVKGEIAFDPKKYWGFDPDTAKHSMVVRLGQVGNRYYLYLHGSKEGGCPIRIPTDDI